MKRAIKDIRCSNIAEMVNASLREAPEPIIRGLIVGAADKLLSGDIRIIVRTLANMERLHQHRDLWQSVFGPNASVVIPTYGVRLDGIPTANITLDTPNNRSRFISRLLSAKHQSFAVRKLAGCIRCSVYLNYLDVRIEIQHWCSLFKTLGGAAE